MRSEWYLNKHRYYELKHFCLQYPDWKKLISKFEDDCITAGITADVINSGRCSSKVANLASSLAPLNEKMEMVRTAAYEACNHQFWYDILLEAVTTNQSYEDLEAQICMMPVSRDEWHNLYKKFFWCLDKIRD